MQITGSNSLVGTLTLNLSDPFEHAYMTVSIEADEVITIPDFFRFNTVITDAVTDGFITVSTEDEDRAVQEDVASATTWIKFSKAYTDFTLPSLYTESITLWTLPAGGVVHAVKLKHSQEWGGAVPYASITLSVGVSGDPSRFLLPFDVNADVAASYYAIDNRIGGGAHGSTTAILLTIDTVGNQLVDINQGTVDVWIQYSIAV